MSLGDQIHELRKKQNLSQEQLAEKVGVARQTISKWELGETAPDIKQAQMLSQIFNISLDVLLGNDTKETLSVAQDSKKRNNVPWKKIIAVSAAAVCLCLVVVGVFSIVKRAQILHPQGVEGTVVINRKEPIQIEKGSTETIVFSETNKPTIACDLPEGFDPDAERPGLYIDESGNFIKFNADYADSVFNPLLGTDYYSYYEKRGYDSYIEIACAAMYYDYPKLGVFSSREDIYLAGGAQLIREQLCAGQDADYYAIDGGLTESG
ncbi:MAG: helix-turn-helix transcriptional regulator, partial [Oscillospiraceae bacterium]|nr:helix-turn-helix transcriptional regulator [Oscillospiraceae bacterium]